MVSPCESGYYCKNVKKQKGLVGDKMITFIICVNEKNEKDLKGCIESIEKNPFNNSEIYIYDNRNTDKEINRDDEEDTDQKEDTLLDVDYTVLKKDAGSIGEIFSQICTKSEGEYIQILSAGDRVSADWIYAIDKHAGADVITGPQIYRGNTGEFIYNLSAEKTFDNKTTKEDVLRFFFRSGGEDRYVREMNNKAIKKSVFEKVLRNIKNIREDNCFLFWYMCYECLMLAEKIAFAESAFVSFAMANDSSLFENEVKTVLTDEKQLLELMENTRPVMLFQDDKAVWKEDWIRNIRNCLMAYHGEDADLQEKIQDVFGIKLKGKNGSGYFESLITPVDNSHYYLCDIKRAIADSRYEYIGFDIFDTLIERPFWEPTDLFKLLNKKFNQLLNKRTVIDFSLIRKEGEQNCREYYHALRPSNEDVLLDEIYDYISDNYGIDRQITDELKQYEIYLEKKYCSARKIGKLLFDWAKYCKKEICIVSDMYLPKKVIEDILSAAGYQNYTKLYLSNEIGISKYSGNLYKYVLADQKIEPKQMCFMGDNYGVDVMNAEKAGLKAFHIPKATDMFRGINGAIYSGEFYKKIYEPNGTIIDQNTVLKFLGIRCMMAVTANHYFGDPFVTVNRQSDFNADGSFIGYYCAGMFLFSEASWLLKEGTERGISTIHFVARDGYFVKKAYDLIASAYEEAAKSNYLFFSRKAVAPLYLAEPEGIYELFLPPHILNNTPLNIIKSLHVVVKKNIDAETVLQEHEIIPFKKFASLGEFYRFADVFIKELYDPEAALEYREMLFRYFSNLVGKNDVIFDVGYSGRMETALTKLLGYPVNSYYFHEHEPWALDRKSKIGFTIQSFYGFKPCSAFVLREQVFTPAQPSCVGFEETNDQVSPVFGTYKASYKEEFILGNIQKNALAFVADMVNIFTDDITEIQFNRFDACLPFEYFMHYAKKFDRMIMAAVDFEDEFGTNEVLSICDYWDKEQKNYKLNWNHESAVSNQERQKMKEEIRQEVFREEGIFQDGVFMKLFHKTNKMFPVGSKRREFVKKLAKGMK